MNMEDFKDIMVTYKTSVLAKKRGFFCICPHRYLNKNTILGGWLSTSDYEPTEKDIEEYLKNRDTWPLACTQQILRDWIEKQLKISIMVDFEIVNKEVYYFAKLLNLKKGTISNLTTRFKKYKKAMENGLFAALNTSL